METPNTFFMLNHEKSDETLPHRFTDIMPQNEIISSLVFAIASFYTEYIQKERL